MLEFLAGDDLSAADPRAAARRLVARALCRFARRGAETVATLRAILLEDARKQVRTRHGLQAASAISACMPDAYQ